MYAGASCHPHSKVADVVRSLAAGNLTSTRLVQWITLVCWTYQWKLGFEAKFEVASATSSKEEIWNLVFSAMEPVLECFFLFAG